MSAGGQRRLIACCDGTWNKPDSSGGSTNVIRLARAINPTDANGVSQIVYYHPGVGVGNIIDRWMGGGTGMGLSENVRSTYAFFVDNYRGGDEIFLFGFSRGAFTARSVAGVMGHVGLLRKADMHNFDNMWDYYRLPLKERDREAASFLANFPNRVPAEKLTIKCIGVWDTVGSLGIPDSRFCQKEYAFHHTGLGPRVEYAYHALAIDEHRKPFLPTIWLANPAPTVKQQLKQVWFSGAHSNVGGGYPDHVLSDAAYFWMCANVAPLLELDRKQVCAQADRSPPYATGKLVDSRTGTWKIFPAVTRTVCQTDPSERIHESVFMRASGKNGKRDPSPYRDSTFHPFLDTHQHNMEPLSPFERDLLRDIPSIPAETVLPERHRRLSLCDRIIHLLGGA
jgi:hypothetical protein